MDYDSINKKFQKKSKFSKIQRLRYLLKIKYFLDQIIETEKREPLTYQLIDSMQIGGKRGIKKLTIMYSIDMENLEVKFKGSERIDK